MFVYLAAITCGSQSNSEFEFLSEFEIEFKNILGYESGAQMGLIMKKTRGKKSRPTVPLRI
jgi:hypothetical protein